MTEAVFAESVFELFQIGRVAFFFHGEAVANVTDVVVFKAVGVVLNFPPVVVQVCEVKALNHVHLFILPNLAVF